jgi:hypothetical protein
MRVKILSSTSTFNGVSYNTKKTQNQKGELMKLVNFGYINHSDNVAPSELKAFLKAHSQVNDRVKNKQFHAMISCKGREYDKKELTEIAEKWIKKMGYGDNPYLIVFHGDTTNNHVHIVSSRIGTDGKKISDSMERVRAQTSINEIMGLDQKQLFSELVTRALKLNFSGINQYKLYFENLGYGIKEQDENLKFFKFGLYLGEVSIAQVNSRIRHYQQDKKRAKELSAIFDKYLAIYDAHPRPVYEFLKGNRQGKQTGYRSDFADFLKEKLKIDLIFHGKEGKEPYGYTIIDFPGRNIFKGGEVMPLKKLTDPIRQSHQHPVTMTIISGKEDREAFEKLYGADKTLFTYGRKNDYRHISTILRSILYDFNQVKEGELFHGVDIIPVNQRLYAYDKNRNLFMGIKKFLDDQEYQVLASQYTNLLQESESVRRAPLQSNRASDYEESEAAPALTPTQEQDYSFHLSISVDQDDEQVFGKNRRKQKNPGRRKR